MDAQIAVECRICGNQQNNRPYVAREMMLGYRDEFEYFECATCGCLQIATIPENMDKYYPAEYYSFSDLTPTTNTWIKQWLKRKRMRQILGRKSVIGKILGGVFDKPCLPNWIHSAKIDVDTKILDVGSGSGELLLRMAAEGFSNLTGIDPFIKSEINYKNGVRILKGGIDTLDEEFEFIMLNHSFEHMAQPFVVLAALQKIIAPDGMVLIRIPTTSSYAWQHYKSSWVQLDAPRHFYLHSVESLGLVAKATGFKVTNVEYDSTEFQFWGSEQIAADIALRDTRSFRYGFKASMFNPGDIKGFRARAAALNSENAGDQACFFLTRQN